MLIQMDNQESISATWNLFSFSLSLLFLNVCLLVVTWRDSIHEWIIYSSPYPTHWQVVFHIDSIGSAWPLLATIINNNNNNKVRWKFFFKYCGHLINHSHGHSCFFLTLQINLPLQCCKQLLWHQNHQYWTFDAIHP